MLCASNGLNEIPSLIRTLFGRPAPSRISMLPVHILVAPPIPGGGGAALARPADRTEGTLHPGSFFFGRAPPPAPRLEVADSGKAFFCGRAVGMPGRSLDAERLRVAFEARQDAGDHDQDDHDYDGEDFQAIGALRRNY